MTDRMPWVLTCLRCGHEGQDVSLSMVDLEAEAHVDGVELRSVRVTLINPLAHVDEPFIDTVPERYGSEYRCRDRTACDQRWRQQRQPATPQPATPQPAPDAPADPAQEESTPWI